MAAFKPFNPMQRNLNTQGGGGTFGQTAGGGATQGRQPLPNQQAPSQSSPPPPQQAPQQAQQAPTQQAPTQQAPPNPGQAGQMSQQMWDMAQGYMDPDSEMQQQLMQREFRVLADLLHRLDRMMIYSDHIQQKFVLQNLDVLSEHLYQQYTHLHLYQFENTCSRLRLDTMYYRSNHPCDKFLSIPNFHHNQ